MNNNEILILKRSNTDLYSNKWDLPGGYKEQNETFSDCVIREFKEETGLDIEINNFETIKIQTYNNEIIVVVVYSVICNNLNKIVLDNAHKTYKFIKKEELLKFDFEKDLIWYLKELYNEYNSKKQTEIQSKKRLINYLFSCVNTDIGFTPKQSLYLNKDIKKKSEIVFITSKFDNYAENDILVKKTLNCFKNIGINFKKHYIIDNRINRKELNKILENSEVIYLIGGNPKIQMENIKKYNLKKEIKNYKGIIIGVSAGAMNQAQKVRYLNEDNKLVSYDGLGLVDLLIYPHLNINSLENLIEILKISKYGKIYSLPNESFVRIEENEIMFEGVFYALGE